MRSPAGVAVVSTLSALACGLSELRNARPVRVCEGRVRPEPMGPAVRREKRWVPSGYVGEVIRALCGRCTPRHHHPQHLLQPTTGTGETACARAA